MIPQRLHLCRCEGGEWFDRLGSNCNALAVVRLTRLGGTNIASFRIVGGGEDVCEATLGYIGTRKLRGCVGEKVVIETEISVFTFWKAMGEMLDELVCDRDVARSRWEK